MNAAHLHLIINHLPVLGLLFSLMALAWGMYQKSRNTLLLAFSFTLISAIGGFIAGNTGEAAEEAVEHIIGISHDAIHEHEEAAEAAMPFNIASGILSLLAGFLLLKNHKYAGVAQWVLLLAVAAGCTLSARAGWLGGKIRHIQEIQTEPSASHDADGHEEHE
ncbi:MAG: hypothetical protein ACKO6I_09930 [Sphingomonadales bacterium]